MDYSAENRAIIWLRAKSQTEYREQIALLKRAQNPCRLLSEWENIAREVLKDGDSRVYMSSREAREREADEAIARLEQENCFAVTLLDDDYPACLKQIPDPPVVLFGRGNRALLSARKFCIVGSRLTPPWAEKQGRLLSEEIAKQFAVVTGFAEGGDRSAIDGALASGNLICVLPLGLDGCYPAGHASLKEQVAKKGLLLSEYPLGTPLKKYFFQARNRLLAGLSEGVLLLSARARRSGALLTASSALDFGRDVFALPYNVGVEAGAGCNELIKKGAYLVTEAEDILSVYGMKVEKKREALLTEAERAVLNILRESGEMHAAQLAERAGVAIYEIVAVLSSLEMKNLAVKAGGNRYSAV